MPPSSILQFPFRSGVNEALDPKSTPPGTLARLENCVQRKEGLVQKRFGTAGLSKSLVGGGTLSAAKRLIVRGNELSVFDGTNLHTYNDALDKWRAADRAPALRATWRTGVDSARVVRECNVAHYNGWACMFYRVDSSTYSPGYIEIVDLDTGTIILPPTLVDASVNTPRPFVRGTKLAMLWRDGTNGVMYRELDLTTMAFAGVASALPEASTLYGVLGTTDFGATVDGNTLYVATELSTGTNRLHLAALDATYVATATANVGSETGTGFGSLSLSATAGESLYVAYTCSTGTKLAVRNPSTLGVVTAPVLVYAQAATSAWVVRFSSTECLYGYSENTSFTPRGALVTQVYSSAGVASATTKRETAHCNSVVAPFPVDGRWYCCVAYNLDNIAAPTVTQQSNSLLEIETSSNGGAVWPHRHAANLDQRIAGSTLKIGHPAVVSSSRVVFASAYQTSPQKVTVGFTVLRPQAFNLNDVSSSASQLGQAEVGDDVFVSGASPFIWDGAQAMASGFVLPPIVFSRSASTAGGSMATGTYLYAFVAEVRTASGLLIRSIPSEIVSVAVTGPTGSVTHNIAPVSVDARAFSAAGYSSTSGFTVRIAVYRSTAGSTTLYRLTSEPSANVVSNDPTVDTVTFVDTRADTNIDGSGTALSTRPTIYTTGGILDDAQPPASIACRSHRGRVFLLAGDGLSAWASKDLNTDPVVAPGFSEGMVLRFDARKVALATLDEKLVALGPGSIDIVLGDGPTSAGTQSDWLVQSIQTDVGCSNADSVATTTAGVVFQSPRGIELLTRSLEVQWIGRAVQDQLAAFPVITSAVTVPVAGQVRFSCNAADGLTGIVLVFDYINGTWSTFKYYDADTLVASCPIAHAVMCDDVYTFATPAGKVYREKRTTYLDNETAWITMLIETGWIFADGPMGFQRVRRVQILGDNITPHDLTIAFGFNHSTAYPQSYTWTSGDIATFADGVNVGMRVGSQNGANPRCRAFRVKVSDATPSVYSLGTGAGPQLSAIGFEIVPKPGLGRRSPRTEA